MNSYSSAYNNISVIPSPVVNSGGFNAANYMSNKVGGSAGGWRRRRFSRRHRHFTHKKRSSKRTTRRATKRGIFGLGILGL